MAAMQNLRLAFPGKYSEEQLADLTHAVYLHFSTLILEIALLPRRIRSKRWQQALLAAAPQQVQQIYASGRPVLIATAHFGNWEMTAYWLRVFGVRAHLVARRMDNPYLDAFMRQFRESIGHTVLSKHGDLSRMQMVLDAGGTLCTLADQDAGSRGLFVEFFGRPASTHKVIAFLARKTNALIVVAGAENMGAVLDYQLRITDVIDPADYAGDPDAAFAITQRVTRGVERLVQFDPSTFGCTSAGNINRPWPSLHCPPPRDCGALN
jgi:KDO2-lipid IV(A) lauroyltransferase